MFTFFCICLLSMPVDKHFVCVCVCVCVFVLIVLITSSDTECDVRPGLRAAGAQ